VTYSYTQISQYLACPRRYRYRYIDGWREKDSRASMIFGRVFEDAVAAYFRKEDCATTLLNGWSAYRNPPIEYTKGDNWEDMLREGLLLLQRLVTDNRIRIRSPKRHLQVKFLRHLSPERNFIAYIDAIGQLDGTRCLMDWKTTGSRYPEGAASFLNLDPQLVCYSWITGISEVAFVVFVRKRLPEIQYLRATIPEDQRREFGELVEYTMGQIESASFLPHTGIRFPQNGCLSCAYLGLCVQNQPLIDARLLSKAGVESRDWLDQLVY
jgi:hypothetical protein